MISELCYKHQLLTFTFYINGRPNPCFATSLALVVKLFWSFSDIFGALYLKTYSTKFNETRESIRHYHALKMLNKQLHLFFEITLFLKLFKSHFVCGVYKNCFAIEALNLRWLYICRLTFAIRLAMKIYHFLSKLEVNLIF